MKAVGFREGSARLLRRRSSVGARGGGLGRGRSVPSRSDSAPEHILERLHLRARLIFVTFDPLNAPQLLPFRPRALPLRSTLAEAALPASSCLSLRRRPSLVPSFIFQSVSNIPLRAFRVARVHRRWWWERKREAWEAVRSLRRAVGRLVARGRVRVLRVVLEGLESPPVAARAHL